MILWILNYCIGLSDISGTSPTCRDWPWLRMNCRSQEEASLKLRRPREQATKLFIDVNTAQQNRWKFQSEMTPQYFECQKLTPLLSTNQELRKQTHFRFSQTLSHNTIFCHTDYFILLHKQLYSLTYTTILPHIPNYSLSHTLLYSLTYPTIVSHIQYYTLSHTQLYTLSHTTLSHKLLYTLIHTCKRCINVCVYEYSGVYERFQ